MNCPENQYIFKPPPPPTHPTRRGSYRGHNLYIVDLGIAIILKKYTANIPGEVGQSEGGREEGREGLRERKGERAGGRGGVEGGRVGGREGGREAGRD